MTEALRWLPVLLLPSVAFAQAGDSLSYPHRATLQGTAWFDSNAIPNAIMMPLTFGGTIPREAREQALDDMATNGRAGLELGGHASVTWGRIPHRPWQMRTSLGWQYAVGARFSPDAFAVAFLGNAAFEDKTAHLGPLCFELWNYQSIGFGIEDPRNGSYLELALVNGTELNRADVQRADLFTATDGRYLDLALAGEYQRSDTAGNAGPANGIGAAVNAAWVKNSYLKGSPARFTLEVTDAGFIAWNGNSLSTSIDSSLHFEGVLITDVLEFTGTVIDRVKLQDSLGLGLSRRRFLRPLPGRVQATLQLGKRQNPGNGPDRFAYTIEVDHRWLPGYVPRAQVRRSLSLGKALTLDIGAGYGGFGGLRALAGIGFASVGGTSCSIATSNALGVASDEFFGKSVEFRLQTYW